MVLRKSTHTEPYKFFQGLIAIQSYCSWTNNSAQLGLTANICYCGLAWSHKARLLCFLCDSLTLHDNSRQVRLHFLVTKDHFCMWLLCACGCLTCEFANLLPCVILIAAEDWKKSRCICYCVECSDRLHAGKSHHEILPVVSAVFVMWGVKL